MKKLYLQQPFCDSKTFLFLIEHSSCANPRFFISDFVTASIDFRMSNVIPSVFSISYSFFLWDGSSSITEHLMTPVLTDKIPDHVFTDLSCFLDSVKPDTTWLELKSNFQDFFRGVKRFDIEDLPYA